MLTMLSFVYLAWGVPVTVQILGLRRARRRYLGRFQKLRLGGSAELGYNLWVHVSALKDLPIAWVQGEATPSFPVRLRSRIRVRRFEEAVARELADGWFCAVYPLAVRDALSERFVGGACSVWDGQLGVRVDANAYRAAHYVEAAELADDICKTLEHGLEQAPKRLLNKLVRSSGWAETRLASELLLLHPSEPVRLLLCDALTSASADESVRLIYALSMHLPPEDLASSIPVGLLGALGDDEVSQAVLLGFMDRTSEHQLRALDQGVLDERRLVRATALCRLTRLDDAETSSAVSRLLSGDEPEADAIALLRHPIESFVSIGLEVLRVVGTDHALQAIRFGYIPPALKLRCRVRAWCDPETVG